MPVLTQSFASFRFANFCVNSVRRLLHATSIFFMFLFLRLVVNPSKLLPHSLDALLMLFWLLNYRWWRGNCGFLAGKVWFGLVWFREPTPCLGGVHCSMRDIFLINEIHISFHSVFDMTFTNYRAFIIKVINSYHFHNYHYYFHY